MDRIDELNLSRYFANIEKYARKFRNERLEKYGFRGNQYFFLLIVNRHPGIAQDKLVQRAAMDKGNAARQLANLEDNGYIYRQADSQDRRVTNVYPTEKGKQASQEIRSVLHEWNRIISEGLTADERSVLYSVMEKLLANARNQEEEKA